MGGSHVLDLFASIHKIDVVKAPKALLSEVLVVPGFGYAQWVEVQLPAMRSLS